MEFGFACSFKNEHPGEDALLTLAPHAIARTGDLFHRFWLLRLLCGFR